MAQSWYHRLTNWNVETLFARAPPPKTKRSIYVNDDLPADYFDHKGRLAKEHIYVTNQVVSSKYTIFTFLPRNLLEQFRRVANVFFLVIDVLQFFSKFSTISPGLVLLPLIIVMGVTAGKDGYEDIKRHQGDRTVNHSQTLVLNGGGWTNPNRTGKKSKTFVKGIIPQRKKLTRQERESNVEEGISQDQIEYDSGDELQSRRMSTQSRQSHTRKNKLAHWQRTLWEDVRVGDFVKLRSDESIPADILICATSEEENVAFVETKNLDGETNLKSRRAVDALTSLRTANACASAEGFRIDCEAPDINMYKLNAAVIQKDGSHPIDLQTTLLRGTVLRNTKWVIGVVLFTGEDTKITLNSGNPPSKRSRVEREMNPQVFVNLGLLVIMAVVCGIADSIIEQRKYPRGAPWLYDDNRSGDNPKINGLVTWANGLITFQNIIPISLYLSIEFVRTCQAAFIYFDHQIYYEKTDQSTLARSWNLSDDLGQIEYIFSDKTGTLTQNTMVFRECSIGGKLYKGDSMEEDSPKEEEKATEVTKVESRSLADGSTSSASGSVPVVEAILPDPAVISEVKLLPTDLTGFHDEKLSADIKRIKSEGGTGSDKLVDFFTVLALCHTVLTSVNPETNAIEYKAQSPDEAALVQAAADAGFAFYGKEREILRLKTPLNPKLEEYELLNLLDFNSTRKRMSVIVRNLNDPDGAILLLTKGADNVIFERLQKDESEELKAQTERHLDEFASNGLRTLCLAFKVIPGDVYEEWASRYHDATVALQDREEKMDIVSAEIEKDLHLLGATAIEDRLQDGVPEAIADLKRAGIKIWVLTGDKLETAIAIGYSTNLVGKESNLIAVRGGDSEDAHSVSDQILDAIEQFFSESGIIEKVRAKGYEIPTSEKMGGRPDMTRNLTGLSELTGAINGERPGGYVLVIDGVALGHALSDPFSKELLLQLAIECEAVICCRVSPLQKALIVRLVKDGIHAVTLAIGDGANDVSMIQAADVGVGIRGEEGLQAVNSSDYAIAQFRFLKRLLLVHGHWSYARNGTMIVNFFYKNIICIGVLWWFMIYCAWSTQYVFEYTYLLFWNVFWTLCPVIAIGLFDRFIDADILMAIPELYRYGREGTWFGMNRFAHHMLEGVLQSTIIFFFITYAYNSTTARRDGYEGYIYEFSTTMAVATVTVANAYNGLNTHAWTGWVWFAVSIGIILVWGYTAIYSVISPGWFNTPVFGNYYFLFHSPLFWFCIVFVFFVALLPRYLTKAIQRQYWPTDIDILREIQLQSPHVNFETHPHLGGRLNPSKPRPSKVSTRPQSQSHQYPLQALHGGMGMELAGRSLTDMSLGGLQTPHRGFDFASEEGGVHIRRVQTNLSERRMRTLESGETGTRKLFPNLRQSVRRKIRFPSQKSEKSPRLSDPSS